MSESCWCQAWQVKVSSRNSGSTDPHQALLAYRNRIGVLIENVDVRVRDWLADRELATFFVQVHGVHDCDFCRPTVVVERRLFRPVIRKAIGYSSELSLSFNKHNSRFRTGLSSNSNDFDVWVFCSGKCTKNGRSWDDCVNLESSQSIALGKQARSLEWLTRFRTLFQSQDLIIRVPPLTKHPKISHWPMSKEIDSNWATAVPRLIPKSPGEFSNKLVTFPWETSTPLGGPVLPKSFVNRLEETQEAIILPEV